MRLAPASSSSEWRRRGGKRLRERSGGAAPANSSAAPAAASTCSGAKSCKSVSPTRTSMRCPSTVLKAVATATTSSSSSVPPLGMAVLVCRRALLGLFSPRLGPLPAPLAAPVREHRHRVRRRVRRQKAGGGAVQRVGAPAACGELAEPGPGRAKRGLAAHGFEDGERGEELEGKKRAGVENLARHPFGVPIRPLEPNGG
mmetsp:Transcript_25049/g.50199  ORF Transcript_25049/g.50199 Transcript_25049/m.50199 type:complete len:200 (+) Transcript_25049:889-1488(+)